MKKILSIFLAFVMLMNLPILSYAAEPNYSVIEGEINGNKTITIVYKEKEKIIKSVIGAGYRTTTVNDVNTKDFDLYSSEYKAEYDLNKSSKSRSMLVSEVKTFINDKHLGQFKNDNSKASNSKTTREIECLEYYISDFLNAFYYKYTDNRYGLKFDGVTTGLIYVPSNMLRECVSFRNNLQTFDSNFRNVLLGIYGLIPGTTESSAILTLYYTHIANVDNVNLLALAADAFMIAAASFLEVDVFVNSALLYSAVQNSWHYYKGAKENFNALT